ncbi:MAG: methyltransferase domain-containing protein [Burkholderiales bacterium]|nr:methyltransferase domain-containing protein [Nitrosomonas sp.]MCP5276417.1 methyltransferase domain-containing protein [Burkholderiales bacterium]
MKLLYRLFQAGISHRECQNFPPSGDCPENRFFKILKNRPAKRILEIGSRRIVGQVDKNRFGPGLVYVGFDIMEGPNVDVVGDTHRLSEIFQPNSFDGIVSYAVWEHIAMPWKVALEINRVLKPGGIAYIATHHTFPVHELPWDFWRFGHDALATTFGPTQGFRVLDRTLRWSAQLFHLYRFKRFKPEARHFLFTDLLVEKVSDYDPKKIYWNLDYRDTLPKQHAYPVGTYQLPDEKKEYGATQQITRLQVVDENKFLRKLAHYECDDRQPVA